MIEPGGAAKDGRRFADGELYAIAGKSSPGSLPTI
jgi:hypothetical protein